MNRTKISVILFLSAFLIGFSYIYFASNYWYAGDKSEFPFYVWLLSLFVLPIISFIFSGYMQIWQSNNTHKNSFILFILSALFSALASAFISYLLFVFIF